jgi:hypothetical protein
MWLGVHVNERAGEKALVGLELWTESPGDARMSLGPEADPADDLLPFPPVRLSGNALARLRMSDLYERVSAVLEIVPAASGRPKLYPPDHFNRVAGVYLRAVRAGSRSPTLDVAAAWGVSRSAAAKWVMKSRQMGAIPPGQGPKIDPSET